MPMQVVNVSTTVVRDGKRISPEVGKPFKFTDDEIEYLNRQMAGATRKPVNESVSRAPAPAPEAEAEDEDEDEDEEIIEDEDEDIVEEKPAAKTAAAKKPAAKKAAAKKPAAKKAAEDEDADI